MGLYLNSAAHCSLQECSLTEFILYLYAPTIPEGNGRMSPRDFVLQAMGPKDDTPFSALIKSDPFESHPTQSDWPPVAQKLIDEVKFLPSFYMQVLFLLTGCVARRNSSHAIFLRVG